ncbi:hypothetical protein HOP62_17115 [Halomonas sp. MCCC 1A17488]|uniref:Uncharacterized protein n=1 Tax=Billgrantia sulfidoxydans TaxID=2733484 RepID=A0ABX7W8S0_9GAMM|nr:MULTISPECIES: hypothetical protein [Halomonas]MCE8017802.1 hypothetical protein [Halomonas sp. MCCC 1A17488]MCG3241135.1 hypothetical protein [Halomonas sp. MCCC 1A17488]QPP48989.1 hypothetical protein I4484_17570 [Halomonas sp. SS10-MC5]QTP56306.1 hypothetical protein HNO51_17425 [Halomonas sulfidoxydans]
MDTRESRTPEEKKQHLMEERLPEDFAHPQPDADQPEARRPAKGVHWLVLGVAILVGIVVITLLLSRLVD